jgi:transposase
VPSVSARTAAICILCSSASPLRIHNMQLTFQGIKYVTIVKNRKAVPSTTWRHTGKAEVWLHPVLTSALDGNNWSASLPDRFIPRKKPRYPLKKRVGGASEPFRWRHNSLTTAGNRPPERKVRNITMILLPLIFIVNTALFLPLLRHYAGLLVVFLTLELMRRQCCYY